SNLFRRRYPHDGEVRKGSGTISKTKSTRLYLAVEQPGGSTSRVVIDTRSTLVLYRVSGKIRKMKSKTIALLAIGLCVAAVAMSCAQPSPAPNTPPKLTAVGQPSPPPGVFGPEVTATTQITPEDLTTPTPLIPSDLYRPATPGPSDHAQAAKF